jgi:tetratricopeptide (TPR) repeat protein
VHGELMMFKRRNTLNATLATTLLLLTAGSAAAQGWGGFGFSVGGQNIQIGASRSSGSSRSTNRVQLPSVISNGSSRQSSGIERVLQSAASQSLRQLAPGVQKTIEQAGPKFSDRRYQSEDGQKRLRLNLNEFRLEHAAALATAIAIGTTNGKNCNPFCGSRPVCPPRPCPVRPTQPVSRTPEQNFNLARQAFRGRDYDRALYFVDQAIKQLPEEGDLFQFRSLILFAKGEYPLSAEAAYTALTEGPGWNWNTLYEFYGDANQYTRHLRYLEAATKANSDSAAHHFLLAYHCLMLNQVETGRKKLQRVLELQPAEPLTKQLLEILPAA